ncbi:lectin-like [Neocloeon triangulifer]|uniref:lectin-like n=1 Tax=Neocloeon triangulifer TaxID=2078957 RepID=UPI00286EC4B5|nr:lectin-like [Neocloeon triangulifer]
MYSKSLTLIIVNLALVIFTMATFIMFLVFIYKQDVSAQTLHSLQGEMKELRTFVDLAKASTSFKNLKEKSLQTLCPKAYSRNLTLLPNGDYYFISKDDELNWMDSKAFCYENEMELVNIKSENEMTMLWVVAKEINTNWWWVSASNVGRPGEQYTWSDGRELPENSSWWDKISTTTAEPDSIKPNLETCVDLRFGKLLDFRCTPEQHFICKVQSKCI